MMVMVKYNVVFITILIVLLLAFSQCSKEKSDTSAWVSIRFDHAIDLATLNSLQDTLNELFKAKSLGEVTFRTLSADGREGTFTFETSDKDELNSEIWTIFQRTPSMQGAAVDFRAGLPTSHWQGRSYVVGKKP